MHDTTMEEAVEHARRAADRSALPHTVYRSPFSMGWWHVISLSPMLKRNETEVAVTVLPSYYFSYLPAAWPTTAWMEIG